MLWPPKLLISPSGLIRLGGQHPPGRGYGAGRGRSSRLGTQRGRGASAGLHLLRIITSGLFDRHPRLRLVVGHLGEALPFWLSRIDHMHAKQVAAGRYDAIRPLAQRPSEYFRSHIWITTSGMPWEPAIMFTREVTGPDRVMYAMDYPYQFEASEVLAQDALPLSVAEKADFFENTARAVFSLPPLTPPLPLPSSRIRRVRRFVPGAPVGCGAHRAHSQATGALGA